jgi:hypothetical protein
MFRLIFFLLFFLPVTLHAQEAPKMLLMDTNIQIECTEAVNDMYNFKFEKAEKQFQILKLKYPEHPLPYFLMGLSAWWKMLPNLKIYQYDDVFLAYMDTSIAKAEKLYKDEKCRIEAAFFLSGAYGFKAEFYGERSSFAKSTFAAKSALNYLSDYKENNELSPEFLFGKALYNYYEIWIREEYPMLRPILLFFSNGDKKLGIQQLEDVANNAFYTRTEAQYWLMKIYTNEEKRSDLAIPIARYLYSQYPDNPYFQRLYVKISYNAGTNMETEAIALDILKKIEMGLTGYEEVTGRYASYFLALMNERRNPAKAREYYQMTVQFAEKAGANDSRYYLHSLDYLAGLADKEKNYELARRNYTIIKDNATGKADDFVALRKKAKKWLAENKKKK